MWNKLKYTLLLVVVVSCKSLVLDTKWADTSQKKVIKVDESYAKLLDSVTTAQNNYQTLTMKFDGEIKKGEESESFSGQIRFIKDSVVQINVVKFGFSMAKLLFSNTEYWFINRHEKNYFKTDYSYFNSIFPNIKFEYFQSILLQNPIFLKDTSYGLQQEESDTEFIFSSTNYSAKYIHKTKFDTKTKKVKEFFIKEQEAQKQIYVMYENPINNFYQDIKMEYKVEGEKKILMLNFKSIEKNKNCRISYKIPRSYNRL